MGEARKGGSRKERKRREKRRAWLAERSTHHKVSASDREAHTPRLAISQAGKHAETFFPFERVLVVRRGPDRRNHGKGKVPLNGSAREIWRGR